MKAQCKLVIAVLTALAAACGGQESQERNDQAVECSLKVAANADAIRVALQQVADGTIDPCSGALTEANRYSAELGRIDPDDASDGYVRMVFAMRLRNPTAPRTDRP